MSDPEADQLALEELDGPSPMARTLRTVLVTVVVAGVVVGALAVASTVARKTTTETSRVPVSGASQVAVQAGGADVRFVEGTGDDLVVTARITSGLRTTAYSLKRRGDEILVTSSCQSWLSPGCGVEVTFQVPARLPLVVATGSGDVDLSGLKDRVVTIGTGSGDVEAEGLAVTELSVKTDSGDVDADFARQPFALKITTDSGDVDAEIPPGDVGYAVSVTSKSGDVENSLADDPQGRGLVRVTTDSGDVEIGH